MQQLSTDQQVQALRFIEFLAFEGGDRQVLKSNQDTPVNDESIVSCYDLTKKWIGIVDDLPDDLAVNPKYMEGVWSMIEQRIILDTGGNHRKVVE